MRPKNDVGLVPVALDRWWGVPVFTVRSSRLGATGVSDPENALPHTHSRSDGQPLLADSYYIDEPLLENPIERRARYIIARPLGMRLARHYIITGRVQGVGFRYFTQAAAAREGVYGWVRNLPDGQVEVLAEGEGEALDRFEHRIRHGPPGARVDGVESDDTMPSHHNTGFDVR